MAAITKSNALLANKEGGIVGARQSNVADPAGTLTATLTAPAVATLSAPNYANLTAAAGVAITISYGTDDPGTTPNGAISFADGDATLVTDEVLQAFDECEASINLLVTAVAELDADHDVQVTLNTELIADHAIMVTLQAELVADHATFITDITNNRTAINSILDVLEEHGFMTAS